MSVGLWLIRPEWFLPRFGDFSFFTRLVCGLGLILALFPPSDLFVERREVRKKLPPVRQVADKGSPEGRVLQAITSRPLQWRN